ncbi:MAG TPA: SCO1664 family protein [Actinomycetota bacterium]|nr:SCO1664 family protein [Actinomycetota bacterium]
MGPSELLEGDMELLGLMPGASNYTFLARLLGPGATGTEPERLVVYKPRRGESPLWDLPPGTLCQRETAAFEISRAGGFGFVPPTVLRDGPVGMGSVQAFVHHDFECTAFDLFESHTDDLRRIALFDLVVNNADRKAGHVFPDLDGKVWAIDHGICFHVDPKLRTVLWDFAGEPIAEAERACLRTLAAALQGDFAAALAELLDAAEVEILHRRLTAVLAAEAFPAPGTGRSFPWPPV